jgi:Ca2+-dependent lipid-binding protein
MTSKHHFNWEESVYDVTFRMPGLFAGKLDCSLTKDEILIGRFKTTFKSKFTISKILIYALAGAVIGFIFGYFNISLWLLPILCICIFVAVAMRGDNNVVINQEV